MVETVPRNRNFLLYLIFFPISPIAKKQCMARNILQGMFTKQKYPDNINVF